MLLIALVLVLQMPLHEAVGTSTLITLLTALSGALGYALNGHINPLYGLAASARALFGSTAAAKAASRAAEERLTRPVGAFFAVLGVLMLRPGGSAARRPDTPGRWAEARLNV